jgi:hypothetical protein
MEWNKTALIANPEKKEKVPNPQISWLAGCIYIAEKSKNQSLS